MNVGSFTFHVQKA